MKITRYAKKQKNIQNEEGKKKKKSIEPDLK